MMNSHKLRNGNKRFCLFFLVNILHEFGFYFNWNSNLNEINNNNVLMWEEEVFCFVSRLSSREYNDFVSSLNDQELKYGDNKSRIYKWCYNLIQEQDKEDTVKERQNKVKNEIKNWIMENAKIMIGDENYDKF